VLDAGIPFAVYAAMLGGTLVGQVLGVAVDALVLGRRVLWVPLVFSVVLEAILGARVGAARAGHRLTPRERVGISLRYSAGLLFFSIPLGLWVLASSAAPGTPLGNGVSARDVVVAGGTVLAVATVYTAVRTALMGLFDRRRAS